MFVLRDAKGLPCCILCAHVDDVFAAFCLLGPGAALAKKALQELSDKLHMKRVDNIFEFFNKDVREESDGIYVGQAKAVDTLSFLDLPGDPGRSLSAAEVHEFRSFVGEAQLVPVAEQTGPELRNISGGPSHEQSDRAGRTKP